MVSTLSTLSRLPLPIAIVLSVGAVCGWIPDFYHSNTDYLGLSLTLGFTLLNAFLLLFLTRRAALTRRKDILPLFLYLLTVTAFPAIHTAWRLQVAVLLLTSVVLIILHTYRKDDTAHSSFLATAMLITSSLFVPQVLFFLPLVLLAYILLRAMQLRTFLASLIAVAVYAIYIMLAVYLLGCECPYAHMLDFMLPTTLAPWVLLAFHIAFLITTAVRIDRGSTTLQDLLILLFLFFLPSATASLFFRQHDSLLRSIVFVIYVLCLIVSNVMYYVL